MKDLLSYKILQIVVPILMILWFYCLWFFNKYDKKNTNQLIMLLLLNMYYVPFYLFRIRKIRKRLKIEWLSEEIYDLDFLKMSRNSIVDTLELWTSKEKQLEYQKLAKKSNPLQELFQQWEDFYGIDTKIIDDAFNESEIEYLKTFDKSIIASKEKLNNIFPPLDQFQDTNDWKVLNNTNMNN